MEPSLATTNLMLEIMAAVAVLEALILVGAIIAGYVVYRRISDLLTTVESQHLAPTMLRVNAILEDMKDVSTKVREETERVDSAIRSTMDRVDYTAHRMRSNVRVKTSRIVGVVRGVRTAIESVLQTRSRPRPAAREAGRAS